jgi:KDO2-lipid IV(A) lauroyltransferase
MKALLVRILFDLMARLPLRVVHAFGAAIGFLVSVIPNRRRDTARTNLELCFPRLRPQERAQLMRTALREYGKGAAEVAVLWTCSRERLLKLVCRLTGADDFNRALSRGKGVIIAAPHLGAWELVGLYASAYTPMTSLYRAPPLSELGDMMRRGRERFGAKLVPTERHGVRAVHKALQRGELVGILPDQVPGDVRGGVFAPFFGIPALTMTFLSRLAEKSGAPVFFVFAERLSRGRGYHLHFLPGPASINSEDTETSARAVNSMVEKCIRSCPEQYQWVYKRFRVRPDNAPSYYD